LNKAVVIINSNKRALKIIIAFVIVISAFIGCIKEQKELNNNNIDGINNNNNTTNINNHGITEVELRIDAPFSTAILLFNESGNIYYQANDDVIEINETDNITSEQFSDLANLIILYGFFSFNNSYEDDSLLDGTMYTISVKKNNSVAAVSCYGLYPIGFIEIKNKIVELWGRDILKTGI
jgi:hypothetical protein